jgi:tetratricopeptide (TPR) repeat protein
VIYSPGDESDPAHVHAEGDYLMGMLWESLPPEQKIARPIVQAVPWDILSVALDHPRLNLGDMASGTPESDAALRICAEVRSGRASPAQVREWLHDENLHLALRAGLHFELASCLGRGGLEEPRLIEEAIPAWRQVLRLYPRATDPRRWAISCLELAFCYSNRREASPAANARESLRLLDAALEVLTEARYPEDFALACSRKANQLLELGSTQELVSQSLAAFESALSVYTKESYSDDWALTRSNMATAYLTRGGYSGFDDIRYAVSLLEDVLTVNTREGAPESWAITQMNRGLALSRLPISPGDNPHTRAVEALRTAYDVFRELGNTVRKFTAAYNLGLTLARSQDPATAEEASQYLEECLPWLRETDQGEQLRDAIDLLSQTYVTLLRSGLDAERVDRICRRALACLEDFAYSGSAMQAVANVGTWLLQHSHEHPDRLELARQAFERALKSLQVSDYAEIRAGILVSMAARIRG